MSAKAWVVLLLVLGVIVIAAGWLVAPAGDAALALMFGGELVAAGFAVAVVSIISRRCGHTAN